MLFGGWVGVWIKLDLMQRPAACAIQRASLWAVCTLSRTVHTEQIRLGNQRGLSHRSVLQE